MLRRLFGRSVGAERSSHHHEATRSVIEDWLDAIELYVEDQDDVARDFLHEMTRHVFDDVPRVYLLDALPA